jgi:hypothetical protein
VLWLTDTVVPLTVFQDLNLGVKLLRKGIDDAGAEARFRLSEDANRRADSIAYLCQGMRASAHSI